MQNVSAVQPYMVAQGEFLTRWQACRKPPDTVVAQGNHEAIYDGLNYRKRFSMPSHETTHNLWYSFDFGNAHFLAYTSEAYFVMLDHRYPELGRHRWGPYPEWAKAQRESIVRDLAAAAARRDSGEGPQWLFVYGHRAMYCSDRGCNNTMRAPQHVEFQQDLEPLFYKAGVDMIFGAHWHTCEWH
eukprot:SAG11_NODE_11772_length_739_cov_0.856250_2_plen_184_part_01